MGTTRSALMIHHNNISAVSPPPPNETQNNHKPFSLFPHFYWGTHAEILFSDWPGNSKAMYALALIFVFLLAVLEQLFANIKLVKPGSNRVCPVVSQTGIQGVRAGLAYLLVLAVMSYNGGVFIVAVVGHAVGYVVFGSPVFKKGSNNNT